MCAEELAPVLADFYQQSLQEETVPTEWKIADLAPIFKKGDRTKPSNYRPVSLTAIPCKVMEHIIVSNVMRHLEHNSILTDFQHGFRAKRSCDTQLLITTHDILQLIDKKKQVDLTILDFSKAFDVVSHDKLLIKLEHYSIRGHTRR